MISSSSYLKVMTVLFSALQVVSAAPVKPATVPAQGSNKASINRRYFDYGCGYNGLSGAPYGLGYGSWDTPYSLGCGGCWGPAMAFDACESNAEHVCSSNFDRNVNAAAFCDSTCCNNFEFDNCCNANEAAIVI